MEVTRLDDIVLYEDDGPLALADAKLARHGLSHSITYRSENAVKYEYVGEGHQSTIRVETEEKVAIEVGRVDDNALSNIFGMKEFINLYAGRKAIDDISDHLSLDVSCVKPYVGNRETLFEEYVPGRHPNKKELNELNNELTTAGFNETFSSIAEDISKELGLSSRVTTYPCQKADNVVIHGNRFYLVDPGNVFHTNLL
mgnify:CR=1 FL=1